MLGAGVILLLFSAQPRTFQIEPIVFSFAGVRMTALEIITLIVSAALIGMFLFIIRATKFGKAMRATADNEIVAEVLGINTKKVRRQAFLLTSVLAAAAGIFAGLEFNLDPNMGIFLAVSGFAAAVIGGVGSVGGAVAGSLVIGFTEQGVIWFWGAGWRNAVTFILLFIVLLVKPSGIFGGRRDY
jgi:branched-subunit amino acid ABC-type transport system permease component